MSITNNKLEIKPYTKKELAAIYNISPRCFSTWLKPFEPEIGRKNGRYYTVNQVRIILEKLGLPGIVEEK